ncbi:MAG: hypothetical protein H6853_04575 [Rhodospirillales bacterium]|nr:hypothetical protein [Alphaproteobacteria bacterium]USO04542.1 MAG: hypothetical protein H6853_04575 [Rhodospirillales bacterium]
MANGWTEERKRKQAEAIRRWKPWEKSTGPKSEAGKARVSLNAWKHGMRTRNLQEYEELLRLNAAFLQQLGRLRIADDRMAKKKKLLERHGKSNR